MMKGTLTLRAMQRPAQDDESASPEDNSVEVDSLDLKLPCRVFEVSYQVADAGKFTLTTEFLLRLLKAVNSLTEAEIAEFFGFSVDEAAEVVNAAERKEYVTRRDGKVALTEAGDSLFEGPAEEPALYKVERKRGHFGFDLVSFCPARSPQLEPFERTLPEVPLPDPELAANATKTIREAFRQHFQEIQVLLGGRETDRRTLYSIDDVIGQHRGSTLVPVSVKVGRETLGAVEPDLRGWKTGVDLDNRIAVLQSSGAFLKNSVVSASYASENGVDYLHECAPAYLERYFMGGQFNALSYFRLATSMAGDLRKDRKTARIVGTLWTRQNFDRVVAAMKHAPEIPGMEHELLIWLRPNTPLWGCSTRVVSMVEGLAKTMAPTGRPEPLGTVLIAHDDRESQWRFGDVFDVVTTIRAGRVPKNFEMLLVPGRLFAAQVHLPMSGSEGYPIAMGVVSFDHALLRGAHEVMYDIITSSNLSVVAGKPRRDIVEDLMEALKLPSAFGTEESSPQS